MLDRIDQRILQILQTNSHISNQDLAEQVALSPSPCLRRVKHLTEAGYINRQVALLNPEKLNLNLMIMVHVGLNSHDAKKMDHFEKTMQSLAPVMECYLIAGQSADYMMKVAVPDMDHYQDFLINTLTCLDIVNSVQSNFVLKRPVDKTALPLDYLLKS